MEHIRAASIEDAHGIARVHVDSWRTTYKGLVPTNYLAQLSYERREQTWTRILGEHAENNFIFVAEDDSGNIVGFISGGPEREHDSIYTGELYAIYLLEANQGRGLGRQLTRALVEKLIEAKLYSMLVWVLETNPARHFYAALGAQPVKTKQDQRDGFTLDEIAYAWQDIRQMLPTLKRNQKP